MKCVLSQTMARSGKMSSCSIPFVAKPLLALCVVNEHVACGDEVVAVAQEAYAWVAVRLHYLA